MKIVTRYTNGSNKAVIFKRQKTVTIRRGADETKGLYLSLSRTAELM